MAGSTKGSHDGEVTALVGKEAHGLAVSFLARKSTQQYRFFVGDGVVHEHRDQDPESLY